MRSNIEWAPGGVQQQMPRLQIVPAVQSFFGKIAPVQSFFGKKALRGINISFAKSHQIPATQLSKYLKRKRTI